MWERCPEVAATQEFIEEIIIEPGRRLEHGHDFDISALDWERPPPLEWTGVSRTVGALTQYEVWVYGTRLRVEQLRLGERYCWLSIPERASRSVGTEPPPSGGGGPPRAAPRPPARLGWRSNGAGDRLSGRLNATSRRRRSSKPLSSRADRRRQLSQAI